MAFSKDNLHLLVYLFILPLLTTAIPPYTGCTMNVIDRCWRKLPYIGANRAKLATCSVGFAGKMWRNQGPGLKFYMVTDPGDDPAHPKIGTLRYGATMIPEKVWITFKHDMEIMLKRPLLVSSHTAIDGRGVHVIISHGDGFQIHKVTTKHHVILYILLFSEYSYKPDIVRTIDHSIR